MLRVKTMAGLFADLIGADRAKAERAAMLAKADRPHADGRRVPQNSRAIMGEYYAKYDGEAEEVALPSASTTSRATPATPCRPPR